MTETLNTCEQCSLQVTATADAAQVHPGATEAGHSVFLQCVQGYDQQETATATVTCHSDGKKGNLSAWNLCYRQSCMLAMRDKYKTVINDSLNIEVTRTH